MNGTVNVNKRERTKKRNEELKAVVLIIDAIEYLRSNLTKIRWSILV